MLKNVWEGEDDRDNLDVILSSCRVSVFFYDAKQSVHVKDHITRELIEEACNNIGRTVKCRELEYQHRCLASDRFMRIVDEILYHSENTNRVNPYPGAETYEVGIAETPEELFELIHQKDENSQKTKNSRVLAGKGRTEGFDWQWKNDNLADNMRKTVGPFRNSKRKYIWNNHNYPNPHTFASIGNINHVGCVDTSQGLDFEYAGIIIAPDLTYRNGIVEVCLNGHQHEDPNLGGSSRNTDTAFNNAIGIYGAERIKTIIRNTYWVLLSRGEKGCFIYCCDASLQEYMKTIFPVVHVELPAVEEHSELGEVTDNPVATDGRVRGTVSHVYARGTAQVTDNAGNTYGVSARYGQGLKQGMTVSFEVFNKGNGERFANNVRIEQRRNHRGTIGDIDGEDIEIQ